MWIRSQDRTILRNVNDLFIDNNKSGYMVCSDLNSIILGMYSTEEKAMEVMDMIEDAITGTRFEFTDIVRDCDLAGIEIHNVFNMPQDSEVKE